MEFNVHNQNHISQKKKLNNYDIIMTSFISFFLLCLAICVPGSTESAILHSNGLYNDRACTEIAFKMDSLFNVLSVQQGFNGNVLIAQEGKVLYSNAFGFADFKEKIPLNIQSVFEIGSVTKQFTAMAIMMLHDEDKLDFNDLVCRYFPKFPYRNITIHQLLTHRSGLPEYMKFAKRYWKNKKNLLGNSDLMNILINYHPPLLFSPDEKYYYSNTGYIVLACIVEKVSGMQYPKFLDKRIFKPLGMKRTFVSPKKKIKNIEYPTLGHNENKKRVEEDFLCGTFGDKGVCSTVEDMLEWDKGLYTDKLVRQNIIMEAFTPFSYDRQRETNYGYGWRIDTSLSGGQIVYHGGCWRGYSSLFIRRPIDKTTVIILCNIVNTSYEDIGLLMNIIDSSKQ